MTFDEWLKTGIRNGWATDPFCYHHDQLPVNAEERAQIDERGEPERCITVTRLSLPE